MPLRPPSHALSNALQAIIDALLLLAAWWLAFWLRFNLDVPEDYAYVAFVSSPLCVLGYTIGLAVVQVHRQSWRFIGLADLRQLAAGVLLGACLTSAAILMLRLPNFPRSVLLLQPVLALLLLGAARAGWRTFVERRDTGSGVRPLVIVGTLQDASGALRGVKGSREWQPAAIVSPVPGEVGRSIQSVRVL